MNAIRDLVETARETVESGYYRRGAGEIRFAPSLVKAIREARARQGIALIAEINPGANLHAKAVEGGHEAVMRTSLSEGACALSVVTEPHRFHGSLALLRAGVATRAPTIMQDFILSEVQIDCAAAHGASAIPLMPSLLPRSRIPTLIEYAHVADREVILECVDRSELETARETEADLLAIANRDPATLRNDPERAPAALDGFEADQPVLVTGGLVPPGYVERLQGRADALVVEPSQLPKETTWAGLLRPKGQ